MATLELLTGANAGRCYELKADRTVVGRDRFPICDIVLRERSISRQHARFSRVGDEYFVEDLNSLNGTFVNGDKIAGRTRLNDQDRVQIYEVLLRFHKDTPRQENTLQGEPDRAELEAYAEQVVEEATGQQRPTRVVSTLDATGGLAETGARVKLQAILGIFRNLGSSPAIDDMLPKLLDSLFEVFPQSDRGYVLLRGEPDGKLIPHAVKDRFGGAGTANTLGPINRKLADRVVSRGEAILSVDSSGGGSGASVSVLDQQDRSAMCVPLMGPSRKPLGAIYVDTNDPQLRFDDEDLEVLVNVATIAGQAVEYARQQEARLRRERRDYQLATARDVQLHFLPRRRPTIPGYRFYHHYHSAEEVGGDYFGYIPLPDGRLAVAIGDVAGKGVSAALLMARLCSEVRYCLVTTKTPADAVGSLNRAFSDPPLDDRFVTFVLTVLDPRDHTLTVVNAGHIPPLWRSGAAEAVKQLITHDDSPPLGIVPDATYEQFSISLEPGDAVVMYTDGISEAQNPRDVLYGHDRIREAMAQGPADAVDLGQSLLADVRRFTRNRKQSDDICLICLARVVGRSS